MSCASRSPSGQEEPQQDPRFALHRPGGHRLQGAVSGHQRPRPRPSLPRPDSPPAENVGGRCLDDERVRDTEGRLRLEELVYLGVTGSPVFGPRTVRMSPGGCGPCSKTSSAAGTRGLLARNWTCCINRRNASFRAEKKPRPGRHRDLQGVGGREGHGHAGQGGCPRHDRRSGQRAHQPSRHGHAARDGG